MMALWCLMALSATAYILSKRRNLNKSTLLLHFSLLMILAGAAVSFFTSVRGIIILYENIPESSFISDTGEVKRIPFSISLVSSTTTYYPGTSYPSDYISVVLIDDGNARMEHTVSMNNILSIGSYRFYQTDIDDGVSVLTVSRDPWGIALTYTGYALLISVMGLFMFSRKSRLHSLLSKVSVARKKNKIVLILTILLLTGLTSLLSLLWITGGHVPMSNGFEAMLTMAWISALLGLLLYRHLPMLTPLALLAAVLSLSVASMSEGNFAADPLVPVLSSKWLSIHVMLVMLAYSLFTIIAVNSLVSLFCRSNRSRQDTIAYTSTILLYPAVFALAAGIFTGAVWANQSWGRYWGWDPKETWALITLLIYAIPLHARSFPALSSPRTLNLYYILAFLTVLMTYFGVNYLLPGLHSYAS